MFLRFLVDANPSQSGVFLCNFQNFLKRFEIKILNFFKTDAALSDIYLP